MKRFSYSIPWSIFGHSVKARNRKHAWREIQRIHPEYKVRKLFTLH